MTHQPPIPEAATSPYPLHPEPVSAEQKAASAVAEARVQAAAEQDERRRAIAKAALGIGAAISVGAAVISGLLYFRRRSPAPVEKTAKKRGSGDDKAKRGRADRSRVASGEPYEVTYFARKHRITASEARAILKQAGPSRSAANDLAARRKQG